MQTHFLVHWAWLARDMTLQSHYPQPEITESITTVMQYIYRMHCLDYSVSVRTMSWAALTTCLSPCRPRWSELTRWTTSSDYSLSHAEQEVDLQRLVLSFSAVWGSEPTAPLYAQLSWPWWCGPPDIRSWGLAIFRFLLLLLILHILGALIRHQGHWH